MSLNDRHSQDAQTDELIRALDALGDKLASRLASKVYARHGKRLPYLILVSPPADAGVELDDVGLDLENVAETRMPGTGVDRGKPRQSLKKGNARVLKPDRWLVNHLEICIFEYGDHLLAQRRSKGWGPALAGTRQRTLTRRECQPR